MNYNNKTSMIISYKTLCTPKKNIVATYKMVYLIILFSTLEKKIHIIIFNSGKTLIMV
jgi:hypothetical protein